MLEGKLGIDIHSCVQDIITIHQPCGSNHRHLDQCTHFYPLQTCSNICGIIVMCMVAILLRAGKVGSEWNNLTAPEFLQNPSLHGKYLRINTLSWVSLAQPDSLSGKRGRGRGGRESGKVLYIKLSQRLV